MMRGRRLQAYRIDPRGGQTNKVVFRAKSRQEALAKAVVDIPVGYVLIDITTSRDEVLWSGATSEWQLAANRLLPT